MQPLVPLVFHNLPSLYPLNLEEMYKGGMENYNPRNGTTMHVVIIRCLSRHSYYFLISQPIEASAMLHLFIVATIYVLAWPKSVLCE